MVSIACVLRSVLALREASSSRAHRITGCYFCSRLDTAAWQVDLGLLELDTAAWQVDLGLLELQLPER